jgi:hypothetical protein
VLIGSSPDALYGISSRVVVLLKLEPTALVEAGWDATMKIFPLYRPGLLLLYSRVATIAPVPAGITKWVL